MINENRLLDKLLTEVIHWSFLMTSVFELVSNAWSKWCGDHFILEPSLSPSKSSKSAGALNFMSFGTFHREAGGLCGLGEPTVSFTVCRTICGLRRQNINFPDAETWVNYKFYEFGNFPGVIGCISGTTKRRSIPDAEQYRNPQLQFSNIVSCLKGVTHDSWILTHHCVWKRRWSLLLLGDSGCAQSFCLHHTWITPEQRCYSHMHTRSLVEHVWRSRFQSALRFTPRSCCIVINATAALHNCLNSMDAQTLQY